MPSPADFLAHSDWVSALAPFEYRVFDNSAPGGWSLFGGVHARPGDEPLELVLQRAGTMRGRVVRAKDGAAIDGWVTARQDARGPRPGSGHSVGLSPTRGAVFGFNALEPAVYDLIAYSEDKRWFGVLRGVPIGAGSLWRGSRSSWPRPRS
ncbi:MAG: hypothetical protein GY711_23750 [bacterium]|nr:hypothetical protein [bacterium]